MQNQVVKVMALEQLRQQYTEMNVFIFSNMTQVSDVAPEPLV
jgi:hypothetical protein